MGDEMVTAEAVEWRVSVTGATASKSEAEDARYSQAALAAERLAMFRALLLKVAFHPNAALRRAIQDVEERSGLASVVATEHLAVVHVRRTDKFRDFVGAPWHPEHTVFDKASPGIGPNVSTISDVLLPWLESATAKISGIFLMSDDRHTFKPDVRAAFGQRLRHAPLDVLFDPDSTRLQPHNETLLNMGHEMWGHRAEIGLQVLAESYAAARRVRYIVGCGSSGVSQLIAQLLGGRYGLDPNALGLWEDDFLNIQAAQQMLSMPLRAQQQKKHDVYMPIYI